MNCFHIDSYHLRHRLYFQTDLDAFMAKPENSSASDTIRRFDELYMKYKFMEQSIGYRKSKLNQQYPDIEENLAMLKLLKDKNTKKEALEANYQLDFHLYSRARVPPTEKVFLWLGANVMLEYTIEEAEELLKKNLNQASKTMKQIDSDMDFLKEQITTTEVNMARIYNWDVRNRQLNSKNLSQSNEKTNG
ncbi:Prefoldin subunit 3 [Sarcoptes scabiei]|uniref:Prefoldin subunit 3 n=1 Tax=Sarcoptes scabiei TaxID=52283 RepID=A0A834RCC3_SARSC|nr:Prefoldin subunit 3 [Sarcoptes scabiei]